MPDQNQERRDGKDPLLEVRALKKYFPVRRGLLQPKQGDVKAVDDVSFDVFPGETFGLVGESGCGKTTTGRLVLRAIEPTSGEVHFRQGGHKVNILRLDKRQMRTVRRDIQLIFQDPFSSLNPRMTVRDIVGEPLLVNRVARGRALENRVAELLDAVGLDPSYMQRYPHAFSGGQRQRIGIARALSLHPKLIVADEPVSALDVSVQAQILNLLEQLQERFGLAYILISHDLAVVEHSCQRIAVMYLGKFVEVADTQTLFRDPKHPYVETLLASVPRLDRKQVAVPGLKGDIASAENKPGGCAFHPRCPYAKDICRSEVPQLRRMATPQGSPRYVACHFADDLELVGV